MSARIIGSTSAVPAISRHECIDITGMPTSTVRSPRRADVIGPIVDPHAMSLRVTKCCSGTSARRQTEAKIAAVSAALA